MGGGAPRERGRPARMHSRCVPLRFPAIRHPATPPAGNEDPNYFVPTSGTDKVTTDLAGQAVGNFRMAWTGLDGASI